MRTFELKFILLIFSIIPLNLYPQKNANYIDYHQNCRNAEIFFIDSQYTKSFQTYDSIFNSYDFLFPRDCFIAAQLAYKIGKDSLAVKFLKKAVPFGLKPDFILSDTALLINKIQNCNYWSSFTKDYDSLHRLYLNRVDWKLKKQLYDMTFIDQKWRIKNNSWFNWKFRKGLEKKFAKVNRSQIHTLDSIFQIKGYPGIWLTGVGDSNNMSFNQNKNLSEIFYVILYHYDSAYIQFGDFLFEEIKNGHIHPRVYAMIRDFNDRHLIKNEKEQKMYYNIWWTAQNYTKQEFENHCREIGCPTKDHLRKLSKAAGRSIDIYWWPYR